MGFVLGKDGRFSFVRVGTIIAVLGVLLIIGGVVTFFVDQAARSTPLEIELFPGAEYYGQTEFSAVARRLFYRVSGVETEAVAEFYQDKLTEFNDEANQNCVRIPSGDAIYPDYERGNGKIPYQFKCLFDNSGFNTRQVTEVTIHPGIYDPDPSLNSEGLVIILYDQQWES